MSIEKELGRIATALESLAAGAVDLGVVVDAASKTPVEITLQAPAETPAETPVDSGTTTTTISIEDLRESLRIFLKGFKDDEGFTAAKAILADFGAESATTLDPKHYDAFMVRIAA